MDGGGPQRSASPVLLCVGTSRGQPLPSYRSVSTACTPQFHHVWSTAGSSVDSRGASTSFPAGTPSQRGVSGLRLALKDEPTSIDHLCRLTGVRCSIRRTRSQDRDGATTCGTCRAPTGGDGSQRELISRSNWPIQAGRAWVAPGSNPPSRTTFFPCQAPVHRRPRPPMLTRC
jgi:hypothetical protein